MIYSDRESGNLALIWSFSYPIKSKLVLLVLLLPNAREPLASTTRIQFVQVGALQLRPGLPLPATLQDALDGAVQGAILVSLGSSLTPYLLPADRLQLLLSTFSQLDELVVWVWAEDVADLPDNVLQVLE